MRYLWYTSYENGHSGLSNGIMSIEIGVVMAFLTHRFLILDGNVSPPANIVAYGDRVSNDEPSRITDLIDIPVPWGEPDDVDVAGLESRELTEENLMESVFYIPGTVDITSEDALAFANGRTHWLCESDELKDLPLLKCSEEPTVPGRDVHRRNLGFYSYFFYLDDETRRATYQMLMRMKAKAPYADLASKVVRDLGAFNAVHMRRGDFKVTYGVTTLDRQPGEAIAALDNHFSRDDMLVVLTDERDDPFFEEIKAAYSRHVFIDHHILDNYEKEFFALPRHDSIALAHLSQLVAAESQDFIGTMTSTFTSLIQRYRGNRGRPEPFKYLWNELPSPGDQVERGSHAVSDCIPLENGIMIEEREGPYSWNRYFGHLNPSWMREWPESFLVEENWTRQHKPQTPISPREVEDRAGIRFAGLQIAVISKIAGLAPQLNAYFGDGADSSANIIDTLTVERTPEGFVIRRGEEILFEGPYDPDFHDRFKCIADALLEVSVTRLVLARKLFSWLRGMAFARDGRVLLLCGDVGADGRDIARAMNSSGWTLLANKVMPIKHHDEASAPVLLPLLRSIRPRGVGKSSKPEDAAIDACVFAEHSLHTRGNVSGMSPAAAAAEMTRHSIDFKIERELAVKKICKLAEVISCYQMTFSDPKSAAGQLARVLEADQAENREHANA